MRLRIAISSLFLIFLVPNFSRAENRLWVKYLNKTVDVDKPNFEHLDTSRSSAVKDAWYDKSKKYMIIGLSSTHYHYCGMPVSAWSELKDADSFGRHYQGEIKGNWDCRVNAVPEYE